MQLKSSTLAIMNERLYVHMQLLIIDIDMKVNVLWVKYLERVMHSLASNLRMMN